MKLGWYKIWFWTKSSHYNADEEVYHNPPLIFDVLNDPAEAYPLDPSKHSDMISRALNLVAEITRRLFIGRDHSLWQEIQSTCHA